MAKINDRANFPLEKPLPMCKRAGMTKLAQYLALTQTKQITLARAVGISKGHASQLVNGNRFPCLQLAIKIEKFTNGLVKATCWHENA